ncbi:SDR family oxidoreductase [Nocardioides psychrotolerans]|uniref:SDR family NAD(P)-dependent oxidoreductase n=1 Tax=Nocardioides psychrotolerans TaxID=1005945 RepID=UPI00313847B3
MELSGARVLVVGATGVLGGLTARALVDAGAQVVVTGRDADRLGEVAAVTGHDPITLDVVDVEACAAAVDAAAADLGGLDGIVVATGVPAFGPAMDTDPAVAEELFAVNTLGPMALVRAASRHLDGGVVVVLSAILADLPTNQMAEYSASKSALSAWLGVVRRENRRRFHVVDVRPPHLDTGLSDRGLAGTPPRLPEPLAGSVVIDRVLDAIRADASEVVWDAKAKELVVR